jgi:cystathionine gamma-synthase
MKNRLFKPVGCGETLPQNNVHAVSVSMPKLQDVIDYEEGFGEAMEKIKSGYPRFTMHPYLRILASHIKKKYKINDLFEVVILSSQKAVDIVSDKYYIHNKIEINEPFGVILVRNGTSQLQNVLMFIQHVGYNLSSRFAEDYLYDIGLINSKHEEELEKKELAFDKVVSTLAKAYNQPKENITLAPSGMNAMYGVVKGLKNIQRKNGRDILVQLGWLYLDTMNIVKHYYEQSKVFPDVKKLDLLEEYLKENGFKVSAIITEVPTNPLLLCVDMKRLNSLCKKYNIHLVVDSTLATPYNINLNDYADIYVESLTKFASGNADVLMGALILNKESKLSHMSVEFFKHCDKAFIKDIQRMALEIKDYEKRVKIISSNTKVLVEYFKTCPYIDKIYYCLNSENELEYKQIMKDENSYTGLISVTFNKPYADIYDNLNFAKGPSLGTEFTLLMAYTYLAHYNYTKSEEGNKFLKEIGLPKDILRISVGSEDVNEIINEFKRLEN